MNQKQLQYVSVLAQEGSFSKAAAMLAISQPSLSQYIKRIETEAGQELFTRSGQFVRLTDAGQTYLDYGRKILALEREMNMRLSEASGNENSSVIIGTSPYRSATVMPVFTKLLHEKHPGITPIVREYPDCELTDRLLKGEFDFCIAIAPTDDRIFNHREIINEKLVIAAPAGFTGFEDGKEIDAKQLEGLPFVMVTEAQMMQKELEILCSENGISVKRAVVVKSLEAEIEMVKAGVGLALVPDNSKALCDDSSVVFCQLKQKLKERKLDLVWNKKIAETDVYAAVLETFDRM